MPLYIQNMQYLLSEFEIKQVKCKEKGCKQKIEPITVKEILNLYETTKIKMVGTINEVQEKDITKPWDFTLQYSPKYKFARGEASLPVIIYSKSQLVNSTKNLRKNTILRILKPLFKGDNNILLCKEHKALRDLKQ